MSKSERYIYVCGNKGCAQFVLHARFGCLRLIRCNANSIARFDFILLDIVAAAGYTQKLRVFALALLEPLAEMLFSFN